MALPPYQPQFDFEIAEAIDEGEALVVDVDGFEGPLHLLLSLARSQKVDLLKISITRLADQYLLFVHEARRRRFALAADNAADPPTPFPSWAASRVIDNTNAAVGVFGVVKYR